MGDGRPDIDHRDFLKTSLRAAGAVTVVGGAAGLLYGRKTGHSVVSAADVLDFRVDDDRSLPEVVRVGDDNPARAVDRAPPNAQGDSVTDSVADMGSSIRCR